VADSVVEANESVVLSRDRQLMNSSDDLSSPPINRFGFDWAAMTDYLKTKHTVLPRTFDAEDIMYVNCLYTKGYDKWYRMFCSSGSNLCSYQDGFVELEVQCRHSLYQTRRQIILNQIRSWRFSDWLAEADNYIVHVYATHVPAGFIVPEGQHWEEEVAQMTSKMSRPVADVKIDEIRGNWRDLWGDSAT
jgi:hypothetical protein